MSTEQTRVTLSGKTVLLSGDELDRLLDALAALDSRDAAAVAEQIAALRVAGGTIDLMPTEAERAALQRAVGRLDGAAELAALCAHSRAAAAVEVA